MMATNHGWMFLLNSLTIGGSEKKTVNMANHLASVGHRIHIAWLCKPDTLIEAIDTRVSTLYLDRRGKFDFSIPGKLRNYWKNNDISSIWCVNGYPALYAWSATRRLQNRPRLIVSNNTTIFTSRYHRWQMLVYAPVFRRFDTLVYGTELQRDLWTTRYGLAGTDSRVIYNGIDSAHFTPPASVAARNELRARYNLGPDILCLGCVAQFRPDKSHGDLVAALERIVARGIPCHLLLVGDGPLRPAIEQRIAAGGLQDRVTFLGSLEDVRDALAVMDIFILASIETFSNAALEAMAMQKAVILSRVGGGTEMLGSGENGILYAPGNVDELVAAIEKLADRQTRERYAANARARVCERFTLERMAQDYVTTFAGDT